MEEINDYELLEYIDSNEEAYNLLFKKYKPLIISLAKKYYESCKNYGYELKDIVQEGMIGLHNSIEYFDINKNVKFYTLARVCIERQMLNIVKVSKQQNNKVLNESIPYESENNDLITKLGDYNSNPLDLIIKEDNKNNICNKIYPKLSEEERKVFDYKIRGFNTEEIATILNKSVKQVSNTVSRIKIKINKKKD